MTLAPIALFTYNRLEETQQNIAALQKNFLAKESELFIFSDGPKNEESKKKIQELRLFLKTVTGFKKIIIFESNENKGLANSIISGVTTLLQQYERVIVLEDDLVTTSNFLSFMNGALDYFSNNNSIYTVNGYSPYVKKIDLDSYYLHSRCFPWGWATWKRCWNENFFDIESMEKYISENSNILNKFKKSIGEDAPGMLLKTLDGKISSWYIRWVFNNFLEGKKSIFPVLSKVQNIGNSSNATHYSGGISAYKSKLDYESKNLFNFEKLIHLDDSDIRFLKYFSKKYKLLHRFKLMFTVNGILQIKEELSTKIFKK
ncbi:MAG: glycosyltransferase [Flavobacteriia bacterium]|nr:glycosyltransferase [Flavobacteriia bacterium]OIP47587.1 MAG: hypothetical protein AUK46_04835 [Flavobacteriaceae bacterium CG2_30_31_66]